MRNKNSSTLSGSTAVLEREEKRFEHSLKDLAAQLKKPAADPASTGISELERSIADLAAEIEKLVAAKQKFVAANHLAAKFEKLVAAKLEVHKSVIDKDSQHSARHMELLESMAKHNKHLADAFSSETDRLADKDESEIFNLANEGKLFKRKFAKAILTAIGFPEKSKESIPDLGNWEDLEPAPTRRMTDEEYEAYLIKK